MAIKISITGPRGEGSWDAVDPRKDTTKSIPVAGREVNGFDTTVAGFTQRFLKQACKNMGIPFSMMNETKSNYQGINDGKK